jgi:hypothetical protein
MTVAIAVVLALGALFYTLFVRPRDVPEPLPVSPIQHLEDRKYAIYDNLRDLQFEYSLGKLSDEDYQQTKQALQRELAVVLAEIEKIVPVPKRKPGNVCPHCQATFPRPLKFCGECGKAMA